MPRGKPFCLRIRRLWRRGVRASVCGAIADIERELLSDLELLPPHARDEIRAHIRARNGNGGTMY